MGKCKIHGNQTTNQSEIIWVDILHPSNEGHARNTRPRTCCAAPQFSKADHFACFLSRMTRLQAAFMLRISGRLLRVGLDLLGSWPVFTPKSTHMTLRNHMQKTRKQCKGPKNKQTNSKIQTSKCLYGCHVLLHLHHMPLMHSTLVYSVNNCTKSNFLGSMGYYNHNQSSNNETMFFFPNSSDVHIKIISNIRIARYIFHTFRVSMKYGGQLWRSHYDFLMVFPACFPRMFVVDQATVGRAGHTRDGCGVPGAKGRLMGNLQS